MSTPKFVILSNKKHPLYEKAKALPFSFYDLEDDDAFDGKEARYRDADLVIDLTLIPRDKKDKLLDIIAVQFKAPVVSDLSCSWGNYFTDQYDRCCGAVALSFWSPKQTYEFFAQSDEVAAHIQTFLKALQFTGIQVSNAGHGFIYPRTISMLINEAHLALEDNLADKESLDTAMKYGVNYPLGLLEWNEKIGETPILMLLDDLYHVTKDKRYAASSHLRMKG
ncbi:MAG: 3-hydroxyacyl-CoA dehydrogenase family protein [Halobacteriovoraceae bacterium]|nr:3-hydroxyacyl-CoA dehydrogenase family protein [Halobacteriovoraceae bacterium]